MKNRPNIILISADSLRANHLGCYGYPLPTSPEIDKLAATGVLAEQMFCPVIPTQPSHTTLFTGQSPLRHGVVAHGGKAKLPRSSPFLPELMRDEGYLTCAVDTLFRERMWFARGYEYIIDPSIHHVFYANVTQEELNDRAIRWIKNFGQSDPFFVFIHYWDAHYPYVPPKRYRETFYPGGTPIDPTNHALDEWWSHPIGTMAKDTWLRTSKGVINDPNFVTGLFDGEVKYLDDGIGHLVNSLDQMGQLENTMIVFMADHGESMTEHRIFYDHYGLYDCTIKVPFIVKWPAGKLKEGLRLAPVRQSFDVAPSILDACGIELPEELDGQSFYRQWTGEEEPAGYDRFVTLESTWQAKYALRTPHYKFIKAREQDLLGNPMRELYDLIADPLEENNIAESEPHIAGEMDRELEGWIAEKLESVGKTEDPVVKEGPSMIGTWKGVKATVTGIIMADLESLTRGYMAAFDERDVEKCLTFFADDAIVNFQDVEYQGRDALREWHKERFAANLRLSKIDNVRVKGETVTVDAIASSDRLAAWKIKSLKSRIEAKFAGELIEEVKLTARMTNMFSMLRAGE